MLAAAVPAARADLAVTARPDRTTVVAGEPFRFTVNVAGGDQSVPAPTIPPVAGLDFAAAGQAQNITMVNGTVSASITYQYTAVAHTPGPLVLPSVVVTWQGKAYATDPIRLTVVKGGPSGAPGQPGAPGNDAPGAFVSAAASKRRAYVGEQVVYSLRLHHRVQLVSQPRFVGTPTFPGFVAEDLETRSYTAPHQGLQYNVAEVRTALFPTAPGEVAITGPAIQIAVAEGGGSDPFAMFFGGARTHNLQPEPVRVTILPLPEEGRPAGFTGAVGSYRLTAALDHTSVEVGRPVTLTLEVAGRGLVKALREPVWPEIPGVRRYETLTDVKSHHEGDAIVGSKIFRATLIPQTSGRIAIPTIVYPVFDPEVRKYLALRTGGLVLAVKPGAPGTLAAGGVPDAGMPAAAGVRTLTQDIRFLKATPDPRRPAPDPWTRPGAWALLVAPLGFVLAGSAAAWARERQARDPAGARARGALMAAMARLKMARPRRDAADPLAIAAAVQEVLANYLGDRWGVSPSGLTLTEIQRRLAVRGAEPALLARLTSLWEEADLIRYAPQAAGSTDPVARLDESLALVRELESLT